MQHQPAAHSGVPVPGDVLAGKYRIERVLGAGGMGVVLAAWHLVLERRVAVKFLLPEAAALPDAGARFLREARAAAALDGQHVARVLDVGTLDTGAAYMVLEHLTGEDLGQVLQTRGSLPLTDAADYLLQACEALAEAHARGIIHRDLKPKNLFLTRRPDGTPLLKVLDFGLSKFIATGDSVKEASLTATGLIMGSIHYMSPEQIRSLKRADVRTDLWALGVILYRMLTGRHPFEGDSITSVTAAIMMDTPTPLLTLRPDLPPAVGALVGRCLAKDPAARVQSVTEIARVLAPFATQRGRLSFESIDRLLPEVASPAGSSPGPGAPAGAPRVSGGSSPSWSGAPEATTAPMPDRPGAQSAPGGEAAGVAHGTLPHASWGNTTRTRVPRSRVALLAGVAGALVLTGMVIAWRLTASGPEDSSAPVVSNTAPEPVPAAASAPEPDEPSPTVAPTHAAPVPPEPSPPPSASAQASASTMPPAPPPRPTSAKPKPPVGPAPSPKPTPSPTKSVDPGRSWD
ncbi:protein kinase [Sorangium cellulosum]|uniref:Protein kinase n=1 Tax=Sorangium cellulosum TaxID=56 RepID=A0A2L0F3W4_SORCE|nr:serine/threonine-protein kinase [Sorangium cellulosum]AUX46139.1 protein kinase [Sorangium cellulosum]